MDMKKLVRYGAFPLVLLLLLTLFILLISNGTMQLLNPQGYIAEIQSHILWAALIVGFLIAFFIIGMALFMAFRYREGNTQTTYDRNWTANKRTIVVWWTAPLAAIIIISGFVWGTAHTIDQYKPIPSTVHPLTIQVVALQWKWLFIYPQQQIASVNLLEFPVNTPLDLQLTSDAPMNDIWIPNLGSQIYEMPGMVTRLHLVANTIGDFPGSPAQISGSGFASMRFIARSTTQANFDAWVQTVKHSSKKLNRTTYRALARPSSYNPPADYLVTDSQLFQEIVMKYMEPPNLTTTTGGM